jgi:hypothetical protein
MSGANLATISIGRIASTSSSITTAGMSNGTKTCCFTVNCSYAYSIVTPSGRSTTVCATEWPGIGSVYLGMRNDSSKSCSHLTGQLHSSNRPSSLPIAIARRPTADKNTPGRATPRKANGEAPNENAGMVVGGAEDVCVACCASSDASGRRTAMLASRRRSNRFIPVSDRGLGRIRRSRSSRRVEANITSSPASRYHGTS